MSHQGYIARRLLEPDEDLPIDNNQSNGVSNSRKEAPCGATNDKVRLDATEWPSDGLIITIVAVVVILSVFFFSNDYDEPFQN